MAECMDGVWCNASHLSGGREQVVFTLGGSGVLDTRRNTVSLGAYLNGRGKLIIICARRYGSIGNWRRARDIGCISVAKVSRASSALDGTSTYYDKEDM